MSLPPMEGTMFSFIGTHFVAFVVGGFGLFTLVLGYQSIADNLSSKSKR